MRLPWLILAVVLAVGGAAAAGEWKGARDADARWAARLDKERAAASEAARKQESMWQGVVNGTAKNYEAQLARIRGNLGLALDSLRKRPERTPGLSANSGVARPCCTGAELCREDAVFLGREAARADIQRAGLAACYQAYDGVSR